MRFLEVVRNEIQIAVKDTKCDGRSVPLDLISISEYPYEYSIQIARSELSNFATRRWGTF